LFITENGRVGNKKASLLTEAQAHRRNDKLTALIFIIAEKRCCRK
jgi:hypothetical protein